MKPTIGRIVHYRTLDDEYTLPAIVTAIPDPATGRVDLVVFGEHDFQKYTAFEPRVPFGEGPGCWSWPVIER